MTHLSTSVLPTVGQADQNQPAIKVQFGQPKVSSEKQVGIILKKYNNVYVLLFFLDKNALQVCRIAIYQLFSINLSMAGRWKPCAGSQSIRGS